MRDPKPVEVVPVAGFGPGAVGGEQYTVLRPRGLRPRKISTGETQIKR